MKQKISVAARQLKPKDMSRSHFTTLGFGCPFPIFVEEAINRDKFTFRVRNFSRVAPMLLPNLGEINMKLHAFYVPFRLVWNHFDNFVEGLPSWNTNGAQVFKNVPLIDDRQLSNIFVLNNSTHHEDYSIDVTDRFEDTGYDFFLDSKYYVFTPRGKQLYHMITALGYNFNFIEDQDTRLYNRQYSLLPLMCWLKCFLDYFIPSQLQPSSRINQFFAKIHDMTATQLATPLTAQDFDDLLDEVFLYYQNNYFTSAWQSPNEVVTGLQHIGRDNPLPTINAIHQQEDGVGSVNNPHVVNAEYGVIQQVPTQSLTADGLSLMQKFARYVRRSNFAGSRAVERILSRFGVRIEDFQIGMCKYLGSDTVSLNKSDVVVTGNSAEAGDYTGKGYFAGGSRTFKCDCDMRGMVIVSASIEVPSTFTDGVRRRNLHIYPLDFYTPELDGGVMQAISGQELFGRNMVDKPSIYDDLESLGLSRDSVFGYSPRYSEYKMPIRSEICGDFALNRFNSNLDGFVLPRKIFDNIKFYNDSLRGSVENIGLYLYDKNLLNSQGYISKPITPISSLYSDDAYQFNRIFRDTTGEADPIFSVFEIDCVVNSCSIPLNESSELIGRGKILDFETNGVHIN